MKLQEVSVSVTDNTTMMLYNTEMSAKEIDRLKKVERRRSIEEYVAKRKVKEDHGELADLYEIEFS